MVGRDDALHPGLDSDARPGRSRRFGRSPARRRGELFGVAGADPARAIRGCGWRHSPVAASLHAWRRACPTAGMSPRRCSGVPACPESISRRCSSRTRTTSGWDRRGAIGSRMDLAALRRMWRQSRSCRSSSSSWRGGSLASACLASGRAWRCWPAASCSGPSSASRARTTYIPTPWTFLRYVPLIGGARAPSRVAVLVMLAAAVIFGLALKTLLDRYRSGAGRCSAAAGALLVLELCPAPRVLFDASIPAIYAAISADSRDVRVLELPFGVRDGLSSFGNFSSSSQFYQTRHQKRLIGGYLSRVSRDHLESTRRRPVLAALMALSEGRDVPAGDLDAARRRGRTFVQAANLGYVVVDRQRAGPRLIDFAIEAMDLEKIGQAGDRELYRPRRREILLTSDGRYRAGRGPLNLVASSSKGRGWPESRYTAWRKARALLRRAGRLAVRTCGLPAPRRNHVQTGWSAPCSRARLLGTSERCAAAHRRTPAGHARSSSSALGPRP